MSVNNDPMNRKPAFHKPGVPGYQESLNQAQVNKIPCAPMPNTSQTSLTPYTTRQYGMGVPVNTPIYNARVSPLGFFQQDSAAIQLEKKREEAIIEIRKKAVIEQSSTNAYEEREKIKADVSSKRELQATDVEIGNSGEIMVKRELFGQDASKKIRFRYIDSCKFRCVEESKEVLCVDFQRENGGKVIMYLDIGKLEERYINKKFTQARLSFGFSHSKETRIRCLLVNKIDAKSKEIWIPQRHGWYKNMEMIGYAFPGTVVWEEVKVHAL